MGVMNMKWFQKIANLDELRKRYKVLVVKYHPDNGGSNDILAEINAEYDNLFRKFKQGYEHSEEYQKTSERQRQSYDTFKDQKIREMVIKLSRIPDIIIEICGVWIWVSGNTYSCKEELKELGLHYARQKNCWYIHYDDYVKYGSKPSTMSYIRSKYGSIIVNSKSEKCMIE